MLPEETSTRGKKVKLHKMYYVQYPTKLPEVNLLSHCIKVHRAKIDTDVFVAIVQGKPTGCSNVRAHNIK